MRALWINFTSDEAQFWGSIIGGIIGVMGAFGAALLAWHLTRRSDNKKAQEQLNKEAKDRENEKITQYHRSIVRAEASLQPLIMQIYTNIRLVQGCIKHSHVHGIMANLPREYEFEYDLTYGLKNQELANRWLKLAIKIKTMNNMTDDYRSTYIRITEPVRLAILKGEELNKNVIDEDYALIKGFGESLIAGMNDLLGDVMGMLAIVNVHAKFDNDRFDDINILNKYVVELIAYDNELDEVVERFNPDKLFKTV
jgi:hypothetical protein